MKPVIALLLLLCIACNRKVDCKNPGFSYEFSGYDSTELSVIIVKECWRGTVFTKTARERVTGTSIQSNNGDTFVYAGFPHFINFDYDLQIELPYIQRVYRIRDFFVKAEYQKVGIISAIKENCSNTVSYYLDDQQYMVKPSPTQMSVASWTIFLVK